jgi:hypothetical protein
MEHVRLQKISKAAKNLESALELYANRRKTDEIPFLAVCKTVEVLMEYLWKEFKSRVEAEGLFAASPKEAVRQAAAIGLIDEPDKWIAIVLARNDSVHDYFGIPETEYVRLAHDLVQRSKRIEW